jgi:hypothetical protein
MKRTVLYLIIAIAGTAVPSAAQQQRQGSSDPLVDICTGFLAQSGQGVSGDVKRLCTCLTRETQSQLTRREMELYSQATSQGRAPPDTIMQKVLGIATRCLAEAQ